MIASRATRRYRCLHNHAFPSLLWHAEFRFRSFIYFNFLFYSRHTKLPGQVFKWTACPCQRRPPYAKRSSTSRNRSNTLQNESLKEEICFGSYFRFGRHESKTSCRKFDISTKDTHAPRPQHACSIKLYTKKKFKLRPQGHSCTLKYSSTLIYTHVLPVRSCTEHAEYHSLCCKTGALPDSDSGPDSVADSDESRHCHEQSRQSRG